MCGRVRGGSQRVGEQVAASQERPGRVSTPSTSAAAGQAAAVAYRFGPATRSTAQPAVESAAARGVVAGVPPRSPARRADAGSSPSRPEAGTSPGQEERPAVRAASGRRAARRGSFSPSRSPWSSPCPSRIERETDCAVAYDRCLQVEHCATASVPRAQRHLHRRSRSMVPTGLAKIRDGGLQRALDLGRVAAARAKQQRHGTCTYGEAIEVPVR